MLPGASHILHKGCDTAFTKRRQWVLFSLSTLQTCIHAWTQSSCLCVKHFIRKRFIKSAESRSLPSRRLDYIHQQVINCVVLIWCNHCYEAAGMHSREGKSVYLTLATYQVLTVSVSVCTQSCLFATPWTVARQAPLSMGFSRQEYWSGLPFPPPGDLPNPGIEPTSPALQRVFNTEPPEISQ